MCSLRERERGKKKGIFFRNSFRKTLSRSNHLFSTRSIVLLIVFMLLTNAAEHKDMYKSFIWPENEQRGVSDETRWKKMEHFRMAAIGCAPYCPILWMSFWKFIDGAWTMDNEHTLIKRQRHQHPNICMCINKNTITHTRRWRTLFSAMTMMVKCLQARILLWSALKHIFIDFHADQKADIPRNVSAIKMSVTAKSSIENN